MWQYVSDLAAQSGHDVSVVPSEIKAVISGLLILSGVLENEELISVNLSPGMKLLGRIMPVLRIETAAVAVV